MFFVLAHFVAQFHSLPLIQDLPPFAMGAAEIIPFLDEIRGTALESDPFVAYVVTRVIVSCLLC